MRDARLVTSDVHDPEWDSAIRHAGGSVFHTSGWARYVSAANATAVPLFMRLEDRGGRPLCYALGFRARSPRAVLGALTRRCWLESAPVASDSGVTDQFLGALERAARDAGDVVLDVGSYAAPDGGGVLEKRGYATRARLEFLISLERTPDDLWRAMADMRRRNIRRGGRLGVLVEELAPRAGVQILRRLQDASLERIVRRGGAANRCDGDSGTDPLEHLVEAGLGRIVGARIGDEWLSATLLTTFNGRVFYMVAGHSSRALETQSGSVLIWECINWHRSRGDREFNLGGCPADAVDVHSVEHGIYRYKSAFGGTQVCCASGTKVLRPLRQRVSRAVYALRRQCA